jgi:hypothetical protein
MAETIKLTNIDNTPRIHELADATWQNLEPGFQVDGVRSIESLNLLFNAIKHTADPSTRKFVKFNHAVKYRDIRSGSRGHTDSDLFGLEDHHN